MRRRYLATYDISDDRRRNAVFKTLRNYGNHTQYSVFLCELNERELAVLRSALHGLVHHAEDQILILDLGPEATPLERGLISIGRAYDPPCRVLVV